MDVDVFDSKPSPQGSSSTSPISYFCPLLAVRGPASISARRTPRGREGAPDTRRRDAGAAAWGAARRLGSPDPRRPGDRRRGASRGGRPGWDGHRPAEARAARLRARWLRTPRLCPSRRVPQGPDPGSEQPRSGSSRRRGRPCSFPRAARRDSDRRRRLGRGVNEAGVGRRRS